MMGIRALAAAMLLMSATAVAQPGPAPTPEQKRQAGDLTKQAISKSQSGDHKAAVELYLKAFEIVPLPVLLSNVGSEYQKMKDNDNALKYFCQYLEKDPKGQSASFATQQAKSIQLEKGFKDLTDENVCNPPKQIEEPQPSPTPSPSPSPVVTTSNDRGKTMRIAGLAIGGAGIAALGAGIIFGFKAKDISDQISNHPMNEMWPNDIQDLEDRGQKYENFQVAFMVAGGALVVGGVALYFVGRSRKGEATTTVMPTATANSAGVSIVGGF